jgi:hypothetical protein
MRLGLLPLDPERYRAHTLHTGDVDWSETNCATDMWIEILSSWDLDPVAGLAFTIGTDFDGEQWTMFTYPEEDLRILYGIEVHELNVWRALIEHVEDQLRLGHLVAVDVDAFFLPDTQGVTYRLAHQKTTIAVQMLDRELRTVGYFHNTRYAEASGEDFDALFHLGSYADPLALALPPFAALVRLDGIRIDPPDLVDQVLDRLRVHLVRRPVDNPVTRLAKRMTEDLPDIASAGMDAFHRYAFGSCRHLGANGELAATFVEWLLQRDPSAAREPLVEAAACYRAVSSGAKAAEFTLARAASGRKVDLQAVMTPLAVAWEQAVSILHDRYNC